jgi:hypothetical protein
MSYLKKYELVIEANAFDGSQTFACFADSELEAKLKFGRGECEIIDEQIEVLGLNREPIDIYESDDISSRLSQDLLQLKDEEIEELKSKPTIADYLEANKKMIEKTRCKVVTIESLKKFMEGER